MVERNMLWICHPSAADCDRLLSSGKRAKNWERLCCPESWLIKLWWHENWRYIRLIFFLSPRSPKTKWPQLSSVHVFCISFMGTLNACGIRTPCSKRTPLIFATSSILLGKKVSMFICECMATYKIMFFRTWKPNCWDLSSWTLIPNSPKQS